MAAPCESRVVVSGTLRRICAMVAPETRMKPAGSPADSRLTSAMTRPQANTASGAHITPTDAMPSVANSDALKLPIL